MILQALITAVLAIPIVLPDSAMAQDSTFNADQNLFFKTIRANQDESYITFSQGLGNMDPLIFEAKIAPYYLLRISKDSKWGATLTPNIIIRMFAEESFPVRTPSYMPNLTFYRQLSDGINNNNMVHYIYLKAAHHSNGQDEAFFNPDGSINTLSGNFSTNFIELGTFFNHKFKTANNVGEFFQTSIEYHLNVARSKALEGRYSFIRWHNNFRVFKLPKNWSLSKFVTNPHFQTTIKTTWLFGEIKDAAVLNLRERFNFSVTVNYRPKALHDVSIFANYYSGEDYYNMQFARRINVFRVGLQAYSFK